MKFNLRGPACAVAALIFVSLGGAMLNAQGFTQVYPAWEVNAIHDMLHWNGDTLFACGNEWTLLRSIDAGKTWEEMFDYTTGKHFRKLTAVGNELFMHAWRGADITADPDYLTIYTYDPRMNNLGTIQLPRGLTARYPDNYFYMQYIDSTYYILEANYNGPSVLHASIDRGGAWNSITLPARLEISNEATIETASRMHFITREIGVIVCDDTADSQQRYLYRTTDAGMTWERLAGPFAVDPTCLTHVTADNAIVAYLTVGMQAWKSIDSCRNWTMLGTIPWNSANNPGTVAMAFRSKDTGYLAAAASDIYGTIDGGVSWQQLKEYTVQGGTGSYVSSILAPDSLTIVVGNEQGHFYRSANAGITWETLRQSDIRIGPIYFRDADHGVTIAATQAVEVYAFNTDDGGRTWKQAAFILNPNIFDSVPVGLSQRLVNGSDTMQFFEPGKSWLGIKGSIYRLTDLGTHLTLVKAWSLGDTPPGIYSAIGRLHFIKGNDGTAYSYDDGAVWEFAPKNESRNGASGILFTRDSERDLSAYCTNKSEVYRSTDSCKSWYVLPSLPDGATIINDLDILGPEDVIICTSGNVYRTTDAGTTWNMFPEGNLWCDNTTYYPPIAYRFENPGVKVVKTYDMWQTKQLAINYNGVAGGPVWFFLDATYGWSAYNNVIYRTTTGGVDWIEQPFTVREDAAITSIYPNPVMAGQQVSIDVSVGTQRAVSLPRATPMRLTVYDLLGRMVATLYNGPPDPGTRTLTWQPAATLPAGMYIVRMSLGEKIWAKQVAVVR